MEMEGGYILLHRKVRHSEIWRNNPMLWRFFEWCLLKAEYKPNTRFVGYKAVDLQPGQFIFGRRMAHQETGLSEQTIRTCIRALTGGNDPSLTIISTKAYSIITVVNWRKYQIVNGEVNQQPTSKATNSQPTPNQEPTNEPNRFAEKTSGPPPRARVPAKLVVEENKKEKEIYITIFDFISQEWLRHTGFPSLSPNDNRAAEKWAQDIVAKKFPQDKVSPVMKNALADPGLKSRELWCVFNNRNRYLLKKTQVATKQEFIIVSWKCESCGAVERQKWNAGQLSYPTPIRCTRDGCQGTMFPLDS